MRVFAITAVFLSAAVIGFLAWPASDAKPSDMPSVTFRRMGLFLIHVDQETGCEYLRPDLAGGLTPRLDENGKPICGGRK